MTRIESNTMVPAGPSVHGRRSTGSRMLRLPHVVWPVVAMVAMLPVLAFLLVALFT